MLVGSPGTKKSSAIKIGAKLLKQAGYSTFGAKKTRQEKFLEDLAEQGQRAQGQDDSVSDILDQNLFGDSADSEEKLYEGRPPAEVFVAADEFNNFIGINNLDFMSILGELWDYDGVYSYRLKTSKSVYVPDPTVSILGGNTPTGFAQAFPVEAIGQGFFSRLLLIYGEPSGVKYTFPPAPNTVLQMQLIEMLHRIKRDVTGQVTMTPDAEELLHVIYHKWGGIDDLRFEHYANRRLTHLLKLCLVIAASRFSTTISHYDVVYANTTLTFTEQLMPKALGEFGTAKNSGVTHKIMSAIESANMPITTQALWKLVHADLDSRVQLGDILGNLTAAEKIQYVPDLKGFLPIRKVIEDSAVGTVDWSILRPEERKLL